MPRKTYQEYLTENGATPEEITVLATPKAISAYNKMASDFDTEREAAVAATRTELETANDEWWKNELQPGLTSRDTQILQLSGEAARLRATLEQAKKLGLTQVAIDSGVVEPPANAGGNSPAGFDPKKFVSAEDFQSAFDRTGEAIAQAQTLFAEHHALFGSFPTDIEDMRKAAVASRGQKNIRQVWEEKYKVADKRSEIAAAKQKAHDDAIRAETRTAVTQELAGANPGLRQPVISRHSLTPRPEDKDKKFFERDPNAAQRGRVAKFAAKVQ